MLTPECKDGESFVIQHEGPELRIKVRQVGSVKIKVDFEGPTDFVIMREELNKD